MHDSRLVKMIDDRYGSMKARMKNKWSLEMEFSKDEFYDWFISRDNFDELYFNWNMYDFRKNLAPSVDRIKDSIHYTFSNMQLLTWRQNKTKWSNGKVERRGGKSRKRYYVPIKVSDEELASIILDAIDEPMSVSDIKHKMKGILGANRVGYILNKFKGSLFNFSIDTSKPNKYLINTI